MVPGDLWKNIGGYVEIWVQKGDTPEEIKKANYFAKTTMKEFKEQFKEIDDRARDRLKSVVIRDKELFSELEVTFENTDNAIRDESYNAKYDEKLRDVFRFYLSPGVHYLVRYWVGKEHSRWMTFQVVLVEGFNELKVHLKETFFWAMGNTKSRQFWRDVSGRKKTWTFSKIVETILRDESNAKFSRKDYEILQHNEHEIYDLRDNRGHPVGVYQNKYGGRTDYGYLQDIAYRYGFYFRIHLEQDLHTDQLRGVIHFKPRQFWAVPEYQYTYRVNFTNDTKYRYFNGNIQIGGYILNINENSVPVESRQKNMFMTQQDIDPLTGDVVYIDESLTHAGLHPATADQAGGGHFFSSFLMKAYNTYNIDPPNKTWGQFFSKDPTKPRETTLRGEAILLNRTYDDSDRDARIAEIKAERAKSLNELAKAKNSTKKKRQVYDKLRKKNKITSANKFNKALYFDKYGGIDARETKRLLANENNAKARKALQQYEKQGKLNFQSFETQYQDQQRDIMTPGTFRGMNLWAQVMGKNFNEMAFSSQLSLDVTPNARVSSGIGIEVRGTEFYDRKWYIQQITTTFDGSGNPSQSIECISNSAFETLFSVKKGHPLGVLIQDARATISDKDLTKILLRNASLPSLYQEVVVFGSESTMHAFSEYGLGGMPMPLLNGRRYKDKTVKELLKQFKTGGYKDPTGEYIPEGTFMEYTPKAKEGQDQSKVKTIIQYKDFQGNVKTKEVTQSQAEQLKKDLETKYGILDASTYVKGHILTKKERKAESSSTISNRKKTTTPANTQAKISNSNSNLKTGNYKRKSLTTKKQKKIKKQNNKTEPKTMPIKKKINYTATKRTFGINYKVDNNLEF